MPVAFTMSILVAGWHARQRGFIVREHGCSSHPCESGALCRMGRIQTDVVHEQAVAIESATGQTIALRRIELHLDTPTEDGDRVIRLLTNLPK